MARLILFAFFVILSTHVSFAQPVTYPEFKLIRHSLSGQAQFMSVFFEIKFDLQLTDAAKKTYDEMIKKVREFVKAFEEEKEKLESEYQGSSGEARIQKARNLLAFVLRSEEAWQKLTIGMGTDWRGPYSINVDIFGMIKMSGRGDAQIKLSGTDTQSLFTNEKRLDGEIDGTSNFSIDIDIAGIKGSGAYQTKDKLSGSSETGTRWLTKLKSSTSDGSMSIHGGWFTGHGVTRNGITTVHTNMGVLGYGYAKGDDRHISGYVVVPDFLTGMYVRHDFNSTYPPPDDFYLLFEYVDPLTEEINFQELKDKYFRFYINDINRIRLQQYNAADNVDQKASIGKSTLNELISAESLGQSIGVSEFLYHELSLIHQTAGSLYDNWFKRWFTPSDVSWKNKIAALGSERTQITNLEGRVKNIIEAISHGQMIASNELMQELSLYPKSDFVSGAIRDYFVRTNEIHCANRRANNITEDQYRQWTQQVYGTAVVYATEQVVSMISNANCPSQ